MSHQPSSAAGSPTATPAIPDWITSTDATPEEEHVTTFHRSAHEHKKAGRIPAGSGVALLPVRMIEQPGHGDRAW